MWFVAGPAQLREKLDTFLFNGIIHVGFLPMPKFTSRAYLASRPTNWVKKGDGFLPWIWVWRLRASFSFKMCKPPIYIQINDSKPVLVWAEKNLQEEPMVSGGRVWEMLKQLRQLFQLWLNNGLSLTLLQNSEVIWWLQCRKTVQFKNAYGKVEKGAEKTRTVLFTEETVANVSCSGFSGIIALT